MYVLQEELITKNNCRHGQTDYNLKGILQGHMDTALNEKGLTQVLRKRRHLHMAQAILWLVADTTWHYVQL